jgi:hypothetical protein
LVGLLVVATASADRGPELLVEELRRHDHEGESEHDRHPEDHERVRQEEPNVETAESVPHLGLSRNL